MREMSVAEQRYKAVQAVLAQGQTVTQVARDWNVSRQTIHAWLARYEGEGARGSQRPLSPASPLPAPNAACSGSDGARDAALPSLLGSPPHRLRAKAQSCRVGAS